MFTGTAQELNWLRQAFEKQYECKVAIIGRSKGVERSARFLNRVITYTESGIEFEADQRLIEALVDDLGLEGCNTCPAPGTKPKPVRKAEHQAMMERRLGNTEGVIAPYLISRRRSANLIKKSKT